MRISYRTFKKCGLAIMMTSFIILMVMLIKFDVKTSDFPASSLPKTPPRRIYPGDKGEPVNLSSASEVVKKQIDEGYPKYGINQYASDLISVHRRLPDYRDPWCKEEGRFLSSLPRTSVVIPFHNEAWTVLLRTVHSVLDRSPSHLIEEIILFDDFSDTAHLKTQLEEYMARYPKVKIIRSEQREGLIRARILGSKQATAPVITFLDSHCECAEGWLEPLLDRVARDPTTIAVPYTDLIAHDTFAFIQCAEFVAGFNWELMVTWFPIPERETKRRAHKAEPVYSPTMLGGQLSIDREFFLRIGEYDPGMETWGAENLEISFRESWEKDFFY